MRAVFIRYLVFVTLFLQGVAFAQTQTLPPGWSMVGNDSGAAVDAGAIFGNANTPTAISASVNTVWSWSNGLSRWNFYSPSLTAQELSSYATAKGYGVLSIIAKGEGFWVNAKSQFLYDPSVTASVTNAAPIANAGVAQNVVVGSVVALDGSASSDANGDPLNYSWTLTSKPTGSTTVLSSSTSAKPTFTADVAGTYVASLTVNDSQVNSTVAIVLTTAWIPGFSNSQDGTVIDPATGLIWMRCLIGQTWTGTTCSGTANAYTFDQANALTGALTFAGQHDWRVPNIRELQTIVDRSVYGPAIDDKVFPISSNDYHWTSTVGANDPLGAWAVNFQTGETVDGFRTYSFVVRLVRMGQPTGLLAEDRPNITYVDHGNGTVSHIPTGLMWQKCPVSFKWTSNSCDGIGNIYPWNDAVNLTSIFGGYTDWRLPTEDELISLIDYTNISPSINSIIFPKIPYTFGCEFYWSKSTLAGSTNSAWKIRMQNGRVNFIGTSVNNCALLVRKL